MKQHFTIPPELSHLKLDERGYPIPFFVGLVDGKPNFRFQDADKRKICLDQKKCPVCGKKLNKGFSFVFTGPIGLKNRCVSNAPMHRLCAEFALEACPHLHFEKSIRKEQVSYETPILTDKPESIFLIKIDKYKFEEEVIKFRPVSHEEFIYENNVLVKKSL